MSLTTQTIAKQLIRSTVAPDARRIFRDALKEGFDLKSAAEEASQIALKRHSHKFPLLKADEGKSVIDLYSELCQSAFHEEYISSIQPVEEEKIH
jgi:uncharacterized protein (UPF0335 family)